MVSLTHAVVLGIIQGVTEWLPISSSGHLALAQMFFGLTLPVAFDVMLHLATLLVVLMIFWRDVVKILEAVFSFNFRSVHGKLFLFILIGSMPTALIGFCFHDLFTSFFYNKHAIALALFFTGLALFFSEKRLGNKNLGFKASFLIGIAQGIAIIPGVSRSGLTISAGLLSKIDRKLAAKFSFLLSIPAILGASVFEAKELAFSDVNLFVLSIAMLVSFVVGYISLKFLLKVIVKKRFHLFAYYCFFLGLITLVI